MKRILVTGSREWSDEIAVINALNLAAFMLQAAQLREPEITLVHGGAQGLDAIAARIARSRGWIVEEHRADWRVHGKAAGPVRNAEMVKLGADLCVAFPVPLPSGKNGISGTTDCYRRAIAAGIPTLVLPGVRRTVTG